MNVMLPFRTISESLVLRGNCLINFYFRVRVKVEQTFTMNEKYIST